MPKKARNRGGCVYVLHARRINRKRTTNSILVYLIELVLKGNIDTEVFEMVRDQILKEKFWKMMINKSVLVVDNINRM